MEELISRGDAFIIYESPFRVLKTVEEIKNLNSVKRLVIGRELTKTFEEIIVGSPEECVAHLKTKPSIKGEFAIVVVPGDTDDNDQEDSES